MLHTESQALTLPEGLSREFLQHHALCPKAIDDNGMLVIAAGPSAFPDAADEIGVLYGRAVIIEPVDDQQLAILIEADRRRVGSKLGRPRSRLLRSAKIGEYS